MKKITDEEIQAKRTRAGGWKRETLAEWGVPWPPPKGWRKSLIERGLPYAGAEPSGRADPPLMTADDMQVPF